MMTEGKKTRCVWRLSPVAVILTCVLLGIPGIHAQFGSGDINSTHDDCSPNPCQHGGVCYDVAGVNTYECACQTGYSGVNCEKGGRKECSVKSDGTLTMFNQETVTVAAPCKYRLADFTCGDYQVKVTGGSAVKDDGNYSLDTMWVKVVNTATAETVKLRTSLKRIEEYKAEVVDNVWSIQGTTEFLDFVGYNGKRISAYLRKNNVFTVSFGGDYHEVSEVLCYAENFSSPEVPVTLCGDGSTSNAILAAKTAQYGEGTTVSDEQFLRFVMLTDTTVTQSKTCVEAADELQGCAKKVEAAKACDNIFGVGSVVSCITNVFTDKPLGDYYRDCVKAVCLGDAAPAVPSCSGKLRTQEAGLNVGTVD